MGERGLPPKPTNLRILDGEKPYRINKNEPKPGTEEPQPPEWLERRAVEIWGKYAPQLIKVGLLRSADEQAFALLCDTIVKYQDASREVALNGPMVPGATGGIVKNPAATVMKEFGTQIRSLCRDFGMTPSGRVGLSTETTEEDEVASLLSG